MHLCRVRVGIKEKEHKLGIAVEKQIGPAIV